MELDWIRCEDCVEGMKEIPDGTVDMALTSPPYDNLRTCYASAFDFASVAAQLLRVLKDGGVLVWIVNDQTINGSESGTSFRQALHFKDIGFRLHDTMIWDKYSIPFPETNRYWPCFEYMFVLSKGKPLTVNLIADRKNKSAGKIIGKNTRRRDGTFSVNNGYRVGRRCKEYGVRRNIWQIFSGFNKKHELAYEHPAVFPFELARDHIKSWSKEGDVILDPFMGSGTTAVAAINTGRHFIGFENHAPFVEICNRRIKEAREKCLAQCELEIGSAEAATTGINVAGTSVKANADREAQMCLSMGAEQSAAAI